MSDLNLLSTLRRNRHSALAGWRVAIFVVLAGLCPSSSPVALAQSFTGKFSLEEQLEYDSNTLLTTRNQQRVFGSVTSPEMTVTAKTPTVTSELAGRADVYRFDKSEFNSNDLHLDWKNTYRGETTQLDLNAGYDIDTVRSSEIDSGVPVVTDSRRHRMDIAPSAVIDLTALDQVEVTGRYTRNTYESDRYTDYQTWSLAPSARRAFGPLDTGYVALLTDRYETLDGPSVEIDSVGPIVGWTHRWNELIQFGGYVGWRVSFSETNGESTGRSSGLSAGVDWSYRDEEDEVSLRASRAISPLSNGSEVQADVVSGRWRHRVNETVSTQLDAYLRKNSDLDDDQSNESTYFEIRPRLHIGLTDQWDLTPSYRFRTVSRQDNDSEADSHAFFVNLTFNLDSFEMN